MVRSPPNSVDNRTARDILEEIGGTIQQQVHTKALDHDHDLKGDLSKVKFSDDTPNAQTDPCQLNHEIHTNVTVGEGKENPCFRRQRVRFSDTKGAQCYRRGIKGNDNHYNAGACAPFRRLHLCDQNLEQIKPHQITATHNLLLDVLLAAKYEGQLLVEKYKEYIEQNQDTSTQLCTVLARSFADIGDIIRGKDLFLGHKQKKNELEASLKRMFKNIKTNNSTLKDLTDEEVREYWWDANRKQVWKAITCGAGENDRYSKTIEYGTTLWNDKCGHEGSSVPTNLDYVPQYLRWFEEWAEDFCIKKKKKLENVKNSCRGTDSSGKERYCSRNGYDCTQTVRAIGKLRMGNRCIKCLFGCNPYVEWINNKKKEFEKQKQKYTNEISRYDGAKRLPHDNLNNLYYHQFYKELKKKCSNVTEFLKLLNEDKTCKNIEKIDKESEVDFTNTVDDKDKNKTFSGSEYCKPCPLCGLDTNKSPYVPKRDDDPNCGNEYLYTPTNGVNPTVINVLISGEGHDDIKEKLDTFCGKNDSNSKELYEEWKCYYESEGKEACIVKREINGKKKDVQKPYNDFFMFWVIHMLKDSIYWRTKKLSKCLKKGKKKCINNCNSDCKCFERWVMKKDNEWTRIKTHFDKQHDIPQQLKFYTLETVLEEEFFNDIVEAYGDPKEIKRIKTFLETNSSNVKERTVNAEDIVEKLLQHELEEAQKCLSTHRDPCPDKTKLQPAGGDGTVARSLPPVEGPIEVEDDLDDEEEEEEEESEGEEAPEIQQRQNLCSGETGDKEYPVLAETVAYKMHKKAHDEASRRGGGKNVLEADASKGVYRNQRSPRDINNGAIFEITLQHSNDSRTNGQPCEGKGNGFTIGQVWSPKSNGETTYSDVVLPPRRQHMCTSNLEKLSFTSRGLKGNKAIHSLLGDVLLSANYEADNIKTKYKQNNGKSNLDDDNDKKTVCRAMKYSFADIGDIIRGKDMWNQNGGSKDIEKHLQSIFKEIKKTLTDSSKYANDTDPSHTQLRADWWEANRKQVWDAMICGGDKNPCSDKTTPLDDYIPQRLRWMTEWAEWYCKAQKKHYTDLMQGCKQCKEKDKGNGEKCWKSDSYCDTCDKQCKEYTQKIKEWERQWTKIKQKYDDLYKKALESATSGENSAESATSATIEKDQQVIDFLAQLIQKSGGTSGESGATGGTLYKTAAGYIHQEAHISECQKQTLFCKHKNGSSSNGEEDKEYAFSLKPDEYKSACECENNVAPKEVKKKEKPLDVCNIVNDILTKPEKFKDACVQKYSVPNIYWGWYCGGNHTSSDKGAICIPPRRRKLYVGPLMKLGEATVTSVSEAQSQGHTQPNDTTDPKTKLLEAFVQSAAVETWFLWYNYNKMKTKEIEEKKQQKQSVPSLFSSFVSSSTDDENKNPQELLQEKGEIPEDFLRQMFYTIGDYRDIAVGNIDNDVKEALKKSFIKPSGGSTDKKEDEDPMKQIDDKIKSLVPNGDKGGQPPGPAQAKSDNSRSAWWNNYTKDIWRAMVCSLTYEEKSDTDNTLHHNAEKYDKLLKKLKEKKEGEQNDDSYHYKNVKLEEGGADGELRSGAARTANLAETTTLEQFTSRPTFFRWLHEWGNEFCKKRTQQLEEVRKACREKDTGDATYCGGDGHNCEEPDKQHNMFHDPNCPGCAAKCLQYRKWIYRKFFEFHEQKDKYTGEFKKLTAGNSGGRGGDDNNKLCEKINNLTTAAQFLGSLKHCKNDGEVDDDEKGPEEKENNKIDFNNPLETFGRSTYCRACPFNKVNCKGNRSSSGQDPCKEDTKNGQKWETVFNGIKENGGNSNSIEVQMIDRRWPFIKTYSTGSPDSLFKNSYLLKGLRDQTWECRFDNEKKDVCKLDPFKEHIDLNQYTTFKVLLIYWLEDFLYGCYVLKKKLNNCKENGGNPCDGDSNKDCACVKYWVDQKKKEWGEIKGHFHHFTPTDSNDTVVSRVRNFLQRFVPQIAPKKDKGTHDSLEKLEKSLGCHCEKNTQNGTYDAVECLIKKFREKIDKCSSQSSDTDCSQPQQTVQDDDDEEELLEETEPANTEEAKNMIPRICGNMDPPKTETEPVEGTCDSSPVHPDAIADEEEKEEEKDKGDEEEDNSNSSLPEAPITGDDKVQEVKPPVTDTVKPPEESPKAQSPEKEAPPKSSSRPIDQRRQKPPNRQRQKPPSLLQKPPVQMSLLSSTLAWCIGIGITGLSYWALLKRKPKPPVDLFSVLDIPKGEYDIPTALSSNRYVPYGTRKHRGKRYIYIEGDSGTDSGYTDHYSDITSSSESEYEEVDLHVPHGPPKYKTLIEVVLEPSKRDTQSGDIPSDDIPRNEPMNDEEWNELKQNFISHYLQNEQKDVPQPDISEELPLNTHPNTLYDNMDEKPFIMSIHDRNLVNGEEYNYDMLNSGNNDLYSGTRGPYSDNPHPYNGIDLINDSLSRQSVDIYDEILKRKENELFGTEHHPKHTTTNSVAKPARNDPVLNQLNLFHKWLDRHRDMCENWDNKVDILDKLKEEWNKDNNNSGKTYNSGNNIHSSDIHPSDTLPSNIHSGKLSDIPSGKLSVNTPTTSDKTAPTSDIHSGKLSDILTGKLSDTPSDNNKHSDVPYVLNTCVSIQIDMDNNQAENINPVDSNNMEEPSKVQIELDVNNHKLVKEKYPIADMWDI